MEWFIFIMYMYSFFISCFFSILYIDIFFLMLDIDFLFVCLDFIVPLENVSLILRLQYCWTANFDYCSALMIIKQWRFFNVPHPLRHGPTVFNNHLRGPVTLTPFAKRLAVELSLPVFTNKVCLDRGSNPDLYFVKRLSN